MKGNICELCDKETASDKEWLCEDHKEVVNKVRKDYEKRRHDMVLAWG